MNQNVPVQNQDISAGITTPPVATAQWLSHAVLYVIVAVVVIVAAVAFWYLSSQSQTQPTNAETPAVTEQTQTSSPESGNTTADISASLNQPDSSSELDADSAATTNDLQGL